MLRKFWSVVRSRHGIMFSVWFAFLATVGVVLPSAAYRGPLSFAARLVLAITAVATLTFALSLSYYFFDAWKRAKLISNRLSYCAWMTFETLVGAPFAAMCYIFAGMGLWVALFR